MAGQASRARYAVRPPGLAQARSSA